MWLTSNTPARVRTARCSAVMLEYSTGISQPPNGTMRALDAQCRAWSGVFLRSEVIVSVIAGRAGDPSLFEEREITKRRGVVRSRPAGAARAWRPEAPA